MKTIHNKLIFAILFLLSFIQIIAQNNISLKLTNLSYQLTETQPDLIKLKISENGQLALEPGLLFSYEGYASSTTALKLVQSIILDKAMHISGMTQLMIKFRLVKSFKHSFYFGFGPAYHYRKSWADMEGYVDEPIYNESTDWQHRLNWLSGEIEYNYYLTKRSDLSISINHTQAESIGIAFGYKYWLNKNPGKKKGCVSCPSFK